jgi:hypothetical protein
MARVDRPEVQERPMAALISTRLAIGFRLAIIGGLALLAVACAGSNTSSNAAGPSGAWVTLRPSSTRASVIGDSCY